MGVIKYVKYLGVSAALLGSSWVLAQEDIALEQDLRPVWEVGAFVAAFDTPLYPAAGKNQSNVLAAPYFIYRGETLRIGDGAIARAVAVDTSWYELDVSLAGSFNANSEDSAIRAGMPDLDFVFEVGPQLRMRLHQLDYGQGVKGETHLNLQLRGAFSTDFSGVEARGVVFQPQFVYRQRGWWNDKTALSFSISPSWASEKLHDYFYQVESEFASESRKAFDAKGGYLGTRISLALSFNMNKDIRVFLGGSSTLHSGAKNADSPLFIDSNTYSVGAGLVWRLWESQSKVAGR